METKTEKFERIATARAGVAVQKIGLMENLIRSDYESTPTRRAEIISALEDAVNALATKWKLNASDSGRVYRHQLSDEEIAEREAKPVATLTRAASSIEGLNQLANGGATIEQEVRWALDAILRGDYDLAQNRIERILG